VILGGENISETSFCAFFLRSRRYEWFPANCAIMKHMIGSSVMSSNALPPGPDDDSAETSSDLDVTWGFAVAGSSAGRHDPAQDPDIPEEELLVGGL
jgi:hypothetical protein